MSGVVCVQRTFGVLEVDNIVTRVDGPVTADIFEVGTPGGHGEWRGSGGFDLQIPGSGRLEDLAHWTGLGCLVEGALDETHDDEESKEQDQG